MIHTETKQVFVTATELEHRNNPEFYTLDEKIRSAIKRKSHEIDRVIIKKMAFDATLMGYYATVELIKDR